MARIIASYGIPETVADEHGHTVLDLDNCPTLFYALGDAPGALLTTEASELIVRTLESLGYPLAAQYRAELAKDPDEIVDSGEERRYALYDELEGILRDVTPPTHELTDGSFAGSEGVWIGWVPRAVGVR